MALYGLAHKKYYKFFDFRSALSAKVACVHGFVCLMVGRPVGWSTTLMKMEISHRLINGLSVMVPRG